MLIKAFWRCTALCKDVSYSNFKFYRWRSDLNEQLYNWNDNICSFTIYIWFSFIHFLDFSKNTKTSKTKRNLFNILNNNFYSVHLYIIPFNSWLWILYVQLHWNKLKIIFSEWYDYRMLVFIAHFCYCLIYYTNNHCMDYRLSSIYILETVQKPKQPKW